MACCLAESTYFFSSLFFPWTIKSHWFYFEFEYRLPSWRDVTCSLCDIRPLAPEGGRIGRGRFHSLMSVLMKEVIVTTETKWQVITHPNILSTGSKGIWSSGTELRNSDVVSANRREQCFYCVFDVWLYANRFTVNRFNSFKHSFWVSHRNWNSSSLVCLKLFISSNKLTKLLKVFGGL